MVLTITLFLSGTLFKDARNLYPGCGRKGLKHNILKHACYMRHEVNPQYIFEVRTKILLCFEKFTLLMRITITDVFMPSFCLILDFASESLVRIILKLLDLLICQLNPYLIPAHAWYSPWWVVSPDLMFIHESILLNVQAIILKL